LLIIPAGAVLIALLLRTFLKEAEGGGIGPVLAVAGAGRAEPLSGLLSIKTAMAKLIVTPLGMLFGATIGREGPTIQSCACIFHWLSGGADEKTRREITLIGAGAGLAAAFNTPLGGIVYIFEELIKSKCDKKLFLRIVAGVTITGICSVLIVGNRTYFGRLERGPLDYDGSIFIVAAVTGAAAGLASAVFTRTVIFLTDSAGALSVWRKAHPYLSAAAGGFFIALLGLASSGLSFGNGYEDMKNVLAGRELLPWWYFLSKMGGALSSQFASIPGGYFSTSLSIGGGIGSLLTPFTDIPPEQLYLLGMAGFLAALTQAPVTSVTMILQIAFTQIFTLPLAVCALTAAAVSWLIDKESIYERQAKEIMRSHSASPQVPAPVREEILR
jgi:H+/Cl- antiporter ClcA